MVSDSPRLPSLDGMRALCICLVLFAHLIGTAGFPRLPLPWPTFWATLTSLGVRAFFVMSGFLITTILVRELRRTGDVSLRLFYLRRTLRIFPVCYVYVIFLIVAQRAHLIQLRHNDLLAIVTFSMNYHRDRSWYVGHVWSLGIEEQFYLLWPLALKVLDEKNLRRACWAVIALAPLIRVALYRFAPALRDGIGETYPTAADILATGCLLALCREQLGASKGYLDFLASRAFWLVPLAILICAAEPSEGTRFLLGETIMNFGLALSIDRVTRFPNKLSGKVLNSGPLVALGLASYSVFMWQQPFLDRGSLSPISHFPRSLALALLVGFVSYRLVERPMIRLRRHWERVLLGSGSNLRRELSNRGATRG
jgi:peptidoglycan/LPS O-acetylase OafA/YrhL